LNISASAIIGYVTKKSFIKKITCASKVPYYKEEFKLIQETVNKLFILKNSKLMQTTLCYEKLA